MNRITRLKKKFLNPDTWEQAPEIAVGIIIIAVIFGFGFMVLHHKNAIEKRYGFCTMTPDIKYAPCHIEPIMIKCVTPGGAFDKAGIKDEDIMILLQVSVAGFHKLLKKPKGTVIILMVIHYKNFKPDCDTDNWGEPEKRFLVAP